MIDLTGLTDEQWHKRFPNFSKNELACKCCGLLNIDLDFLDNIQGAREFAEIPFPVNSACRCEEYNKKVGGHPTSLHITTEIKQCGAIDIGCTSNRKRGIIIDIIVAYDFTHIGMAKDFIHVDNKQKIAVWLY